MSFSNLQRGDQTKCLFCCFYCCLIKLNHLYTDLFKVYVFLLFSPIRSTVCAGTTGFKKDAVISYLIDVSHEKQVIIVTAVGWREFISCVIKSSTSTIKSFTFVFFHSCLSLLSLSCSRINILSCLCAAFTAFLACYISRNFHFASWYLILKPLYLPTPTAMCFLYSCRLHTSCLLIQNRFDWRAIFRDFCTGMTLNY